MSNEIQIFNNPEFGQIRTAGTSDNPLFCLTDICKVLELQPSRVKGRLEDGVTSSNPIVDSLGREQLAVFVNEDGLYDVIIDSRKPEAKAFRKWITSEVLPTIRKHGAYMTDEALTRAITEPDFLIQLATALKEEKNKRLSMEQVCEEQKVQIEDLTKKVSYLDLILASTNTVTITQIAQDYGMSGRAFNKLLNEQKVQYKVGTQWILYAKYKDKSYVSSETVHFEGSDGTQHTTLNTKWTQKGRLFLYDLLKGLGIYPTIEADQILRARDKNETRNPEINFENFTDENE
jgi:anti-repressor protein